VTASSSPAPKPTPRPAQPPAVASVAPVSATVDDPSVGQLVADASTHLSTIVRGEIELAKLELRSSVKNAGTGIGMFLGAAVLLLFSLVYAFQSLAEGIAALGVYRWLAFLIVFVFQVLVAGLLAYLGFKKVKRVKAPERTIRTTKETVDYLKKSRG
jgi:putative superfamily III holin-X